MKKLIVTTIVALFLFTSTAVAGDWRHDTFKGIVVVTIPTVEIFIPLPQILHLEMVHRDSRPHHPHWDHHPHHPHGDPHGDHHGDRPHWNPHPHMEMEEMEMETPHHP